MDRKKFFDTLKPKRYRNGYPQTAVVALDGFLDEALLTGKPLTHVAYDMATAFHEVGSALKPKRENLNYTTAARIRAVWPSRFKSNAAAQPYVRQPKKLANKVYGGRLGNTGPNDGWTYRGGGFPQTTGKENYSKVGRLVGVDLVKNPERIAEPRIATIALMSSTTSGLYTGKKLSDYNLPAEYAQARAIINADVKANGPKVAALARDFEAALRAAGYGVAASVNPVPAPKPQPEPSGPVAHAPAPEKRFSPSVYVAAVVAFIVSGTVYSAEWVAEKACQYLNLFCGG